MNYNNSSKIQFISFAILFLGALLVTKLFFVQVIHGAAYSEEANRQYISPRGNIFERGSILFTQKDGNTVSAAGLKVGYKIAIVPKNIVDGEHAYSALSQIIPIDHDSFIQKVAKKSDPYEEIAVKVSKEDADKIDALHMSGISIYEQKWRFYPSSTMAAQTIGFVGYKGDDFSGRYGLEKYYNDVLERTEENLNVNFFAEVFSNISDSLFSNGKIEGDIQTTIEPSVEDYLEQQLASVHDTYHPDAEGGIIINPKTGAIYAMSSLPNFDLNDFSGVTDPLTFSNPLAENVFEMGSVIKPLAMSAALDAGVLTAQTTYNDTGSVTLNGKKISNFDGKARGVIPMQEVLNQSLNVGMVAVEQKLGKDKLRDYFLGYGLGEKSGIDLPHEIPSLVGNLQSPRDVEYATAAFGQGIALTPLATVRAFSAMVNGGTLITPHLVQKIIYKDGGEKVPVYPTSKSKISPQTSEAISRMLVTVYDKALKGGIYKMDHYSIASKTGTAQVANPGGGGYYKDRYLHSFVGYFPAYDPQFLVFLYAVNPKGVEYASASLAEPFVNIAKFLLNYYNVSPDR